MIRVFIILLFLVPALLAYSAGANAQDGEPIVESSADYSFGQEIRFNLQAVNASDVQEVTLFFRPELSSNIYEVNVPFEAGSTISLTQPVAVSGLDVRPFSDVTYSWQLRTADGVQIVPDRLFTYEDDRFTWQSMVRNGTTAHWTDASPLFGQSVLDAADGAMSDLLQVIPLEEMAPVDIYVYPSTADIRTALRLAGIEEETAVPHQLGVLLISSVNIETAEADLQHTVPYELAQLLLHRAAGEQIDAIPWWLREGIAEDTRLNKNPRVDQLLVDAVRSETTIPLWRLCDQPLETADRTELASAQSASLIRYLSVNEPPGSVSNLLSAYVAGDNCEQGVQRIFGLSLDELEDQWLSDMQEPTAAQLLINEAAPWFLLLLGGSLLVMFVMFATRKKG